MPGSTSWRRASTRGDRAELLIRERELRLKGRRSRLAYPDAREGWSGYAGLVRLDYRWRVAQRFLGDIQTGMNGGTA